MSGEMPPQWMWPFGEELEAWFEEVERKRKERFGGDSDTDSDDSQPMLQNELSKGRR